MQRTILWGIVYGAVMLTSLTEAFTFSEAALPRQKRQSVRAVVQGCTVSPTGADDAKTPAKENSVIAINCATDKAYDSCAVQHVIPMDVGKPVGGYQTDNTIKCIGDVQKNGQTCLKDSRITYVMSLNQCGIRISRATADDTGKWLFTVSEMSETGSGTYNTKEITIYTYNKTTVDLTDDRSSIITRDIEIWYNYDENREEWRSGSGGFQKVFLNCNARGGRPEPAITWMINNDERNSFGNSNNGNSNSNSNSAANKIFNTRDTPGATYDSSGYIRDKISQLDFDVDREMMDFLKSTYGIDTNPSSGQFSFELSCNVDQVDYSSERVRTTINVRRVYFENKLRGATVGWIVGGVLVGLLLLVLILLTVWARATARLCFADDEYKYGNPNDPKRRPRTQPQR